MPRSTQTGLEDQCQILRVINQALSRIDERLVNHGERVAFFALSIAKELPSWPTVQRKLYMLCIFHDIGAYKTEEIDNMFHFESVNVWRHSIYGYLFFKNMTPMADLAEAILYHHLKWEDLVAEQLPSVPYSALIGFADRLDMLLATGQDQNLFNSIHRQGWFASELVEAYVRVSQKMDLVEMVRTGVYKSVLDEFIADFQFNNELNLSFLDMLVYSIDFRSEYTVTHSVNTTAWTMAIASRLGIEGVQAERLYLGAWLHDVGKIAVPVGILEKTGSLTDTEMQTMRKHVVFTAEILSGLAPPDIVAIASNHHEKLNGRGYPDGLSAKDLSLPERIVAVADIMSALVSARSYKKPFSKEKTMDILTRMVASGELDPVVCMLVIQKFDQINEETISKCTQTTIQYDNMRDDYIVLMEVIAAGGLPRPSDIFK